jgi:2,4-dienoyl-CoA reductase-like NADH-dependent reductase (Old Yellow Enzyme family)/thioredoxin reductase
MASGTKYAHILQPLRIGNTVFRNRLFSAPTGLYDLTPAFAPTDDYIAYYERKAKGGCASINIGECNIDNEGVGSPNSYELPNLSEHKWNKEALGKLANAISRNGAVATIELQKTGRIKSDTPGQMQLLSPSDGFHPYDSRVKCRAMTEEEILATIDAYASAAEYAKGRGFGMVMVHAGHGWLLHQFHCPKSNRRTDKWGGSPENRCRFTVAVVDEIHRRCGRDFPVEVRISGSEAFEGGYQIDEGEEIAKQLDGHADIIHVSCGNLFSPGTDFHTHPGIFQQEGMNVKYAAEIKKHVKQSWVATIGGLSDLDVLEEIVASGKADIVEMARGLICDPDLALKAQSGREKEARKCLRCFKCVGQDYQDGRLFCAINPASGKEREAARIPHPLGLRKVLVAGGGIAGMQAAITAREIGHEVILCEKGPALGGVLLCEREVPFKKRIGEYIERQKYMLEKLGVEVRLNTEVTPALCGELQPDVIVAALGAVTAAPSIPGLTGEKVKDAIAVYTDPALARGKCVILGAGTTGLELAIFLASLGKEVRILEARSAKEVSVGTYGMQLRNYGLKVEFGVRAEEILPEGVKVSGEEEGIIPCDTVINALGRRPLWDEADSLRFCAPEFHQIGDCLKVRNLMATTSEAWTIARNIGCY